MKKSNLLKYIIVAFVVLLFLGVTVLMIIITRGGIITPDGILETGVIKVAVEPEDVKFNVFINDEPIKLEDKRINGLETGTYNIKIESEGYANWEKDLKVTSGLVSEINARLYPTKFDLNQVTNSNIDQVFFSENGEYVYYVIIDTEFGNEKGIWRLKLTESQFLFGNQQNSPEKIADIFSEISPALEAGEYSLKISPNNQKLLFYDNSSSSVYLLNATEYNQQLGIDIILELGFVPDKISWFKGDTALIVMDDNVLYEKDLENGRQTLIKYSDTSELIYAINDDEVYYYDSFGEQIQIYRDGVSEPVTAINTTIPQNVLGIYAAKENEDLLIVRNELGYFYLNLEKSVVKEIADASYQFITIAKDGRSAVFVKDNALYAFSAKEVIATNSIEVKFNQVTNEFDVSADKVRYTPQSSHILLYSSSLNTVKIAERDGANLLEIITEQSVKNSSFYVNSDGESFLVLLTDEVENTENTMPRANLYRVDLVTR
jgi:hypothetical protein